MTSTEERQKVFACLNDDEPTPEALMYERLAREPNAIEDREEANRVISEAVIDNEIRWVAFHGWMKGGRPGV